MKYLVIGAGGTGGGIGAFLTRAGKDVTLIARGRHLEKMRKNGLKVEHPDGDFTVPVSACTMEEYQDVPDVIFVCVKGYSLKEAIDFIRKRADSHTVVIPVLNIYGTGGRMQEELPDIPVTDGCIYIASEIKEPGVIFMSGRIFRVVYGLRHNTEEEIRKRVMPVLEKVGTDLSEAGIKAVLSSWIERDALQKFSFVSPMAAIAGCYDILAKDMQKEGEMRNLFIAMVKEVEALSHKIGAGLPEDIVQINLKIMDHMAPSSTASMHRDIRDGHPSEVDGLVYEVVRMGEKYQVPVPCYKKISDKYREMGIF